MLFGCRQATRLTAITCEGRHRAGSPDTTTEHTTVGQTRKSASHSDILFVVPAESSDSAGSAAESEDPSTTNPLNAIKHG